MVEVDLKQYDSGRHTLYLPELELRVMFDRVETSSIDGHFQFYQDDVQIVDIHRQRCPDELMFALDEYINDA